MTSFPMRLTGFEEYMLRDDRVAYPTVFGMLYTFRGRPDLTRLNDAARLALQRHPLLTARIDWRSGKPYWIEGEPLPKQIIAINESADFPSIRAIDLRRERGVHLAGQLTDGGCRLFTQVHHSCCDGLGLRGFLLEMLSIYAGQEDALPLLDARLLAGRARSIRTARQMLGQLPKLFFYLVGNFGYFLRHPVSVIPVETPLRDGRCPAYAKPSGRCGTYLTHRYSREETRDILVMCSGVNGTTYHGNSNDDLSTLLDYQAMAGVEFSF